MQWRFMQHLKAKQNKRKAQNMATVLKKKDFRKKLKVLFIYLHKVFGDKPELIS